MAKDFNLDDISMLWKEFKERRGQQLEHKKWCDEFRDSLKRLSGDASAFRLRGQKVAELRPGALNKTLLAKEQPDVIAKYTTMTVVERFDEDKFRAEEPDLFKHYQAQTLHLVDTPSIEGLQ